MRAWLQNFRENSGTQVAFSLLISRIIGFLSVLFLVHLLTKEEFGLLTIVLNISNFFIPLLGFGSSHALLRFGAAIKDDATRSLLTKYSNYQGLLLQMAVNVVMLLFAVFTHFGNIEVMCMSAVMMIRLTGLFFIEQAKAETRANLDNRSYARLELFSNVFIFALSLLGAWIWGVWGYVLANSLSPFIIFLFHKFEVGKSDSLTVTKKEFWNYAIPSVMALMLFVGITNIDIFFAGYFFKESGASFYRISVLIQLNLVFVAQIYTQTMFPKLCENHRNPQYLSRFFFNYLKIYLPLTVVFVTLGFVFSKDLLRLFGYDYSSDVILKIAFLQMAAAILLRTPLGSLLSAVGLIRVSVTVGAVTLAAIIGAAFIWLPAYGMEGLAYIMLLSNIFSGTLLLLSYLWYRRNNRLS